MRRTKTWAIGQLDTGRTCLETSLIQGNCTYSVIQEQFMLWLPESSILLRLSFLSCLIVLSPYLRPTRGCRLPCISAARRRERPVSPCSYKCQHNSRPWPRIRVLSTFPQSRPNKAKNQNDRSGRVAVNIITVVDLSAKNRLSVLVVSQRGR